MTKAEAVGALRVLSGLIIIWGFFQIGSGWGRSMRLCGFVIPAWLPGVLLALLGVNYWFRVNRIAQRVEK